MPVRSTFSIGTSVALHKQRTIRLSKEIASF